MRALYFTDTYPPQVNGVSVVTALSVQGLRARGWEVEVIGPRYPAGPDVFGADRPEMLMTFPSIPMPGYPDVRLALPRPGPARAAARRFGPDLVHAATEFAAGWAARRVAAALGVPLVTSYHTDFGRYAASYGWPRLQRPVTNYLTRFHRRARRTLTPSTVTRDELAAQGIRHAVVWGCGVDPVRFHPDRRSAALRHQLGAEGKFVFLHVGRLAPEKSVGRLMAAFARCRARLGDRVMLVVAGDGPSRPALQQTAPAGVTFLGFLDRTADLPALYASADAFLFSSEAETLGLVVLEAMASGLPVVAAPAGGVADHLRHGVNGLAYPPGDGDRMAAYMEELVAERPLRESLADGARRTGLALGWDRELDRLDRCYRDVIDRRVEGTAYAGDPIVDPATAR